MIPPPPLQPPCFVSTKAAPLRSLSSRRAVPACNPSRSTPNLVFRYDAQAPPAQSRNGCVAKGQRQRQTTNGSAPHSPTPLISPLHIFASSRASAGVAAGCARATHDLRRGLLPRCPHGLPSRRRQAQREQVASRETEDNGKQEHILVEHHQELWGKCAEAGKKCEKSDRMGKKQQVFSTAALL